MVKTNYETLIYYEKIYNETLENYQTSHKLLCNTMVINKTVSHCT